MQGGSLLFLIIQLNGKAQSSVQRIKGALRVVALDGKTAHGQGCVDVLRIRFENLLVIFASFGKISRLLVESRQCRLRVRIPGRSLGDGLISFDRGGEILGDLGLNRKHQLLLCSGRLWLTPTAL